MDFSIAESSSWLQNDNAKDVSDVIFAISRLHRREDIREMIRFNWDEKSYGQSCVHALQIFIQCSHSLPAWILFQEANSQTSVDRLRVLTDLFLYAEDTLVETRLYDSVQ